MHRILIGDGICRNRTDLHFEAVDPENGIPATPGRHTPPSPTRKGGTIVFGLRKGTEGLKVVGVGNAEGLIGDL